MNNYPSAIAIAALCSLVPVGSALAATNDTRAGAAGGVLVSINPRANITPSFPPPAMARTRTASRPKVVCEWSYSIDRSLRVTISVTCDGRLDQIAIDLSFLDLEGTSVRSEATRNFTAVASASASTHSSNKEEKQLAVCVSGRIMSPGGASLDSSCGVIALPHVAMYPTRLRNSQSALCMGVRAGSGKPGAAVVQSRCTTDADQGWSLAYLAGEGLPYPRGTQGFIANYGANNRCLGTQGGKSDKLTPVVLAACQAANVDQLWLPVKVQVGTVSGYALHNQKAKGKCLSVPSDSPRGGGQLAISDCNGHDEQIWYRDVEFTPARAYQ